MFLKMFSFRRLEVEPSVGKGLHMRKKSLDKGMKFVLQKREMLKNIFVMKNNLPGSQFSRQPNVHQ